MKRVLAILAHALICAVLLGIPLKTFADEQAVPEESVAAQPDENQLTQQMQNLDGYEPSSDMIHAVQELPDVE